MANGSPGFPVGPDQIRPGLLPDVLTGFQQFLLRGNVLDLAVGIVIGGAFGAIVTAHVKDLITPLAAALFGKPDFSALEFTVSGNRVPVGDS